MQVLANSNIDPEDFFSGLKEAEDAGHHQELPPGQIHSVKDLMMPALARVGLLTPTVRKKYEEAGIPIFDDPRVSGSDGRRPPGRRLIRPTDPRRRSGLDKSRTADAVRGRRE